MTDSTCKTNSFIIYLSHKLIQIAWIALYIQTLSDSVYTGISL